VRNCFTIITCTYRDTKGDAALAVNLCKLLLQKYPCNTVRLIIAVDHEQNLDGQKIWQHELQVFCKKMRISAEQIQLKLIVYQDNLRDDPILQADFVDSLCIIGYPLGRRFSMPILRSGTPHLFIGAYGEQHTLHPLSTTILPTGLDPTAALSGVWIDDKPSAPMELDIQDQPKYTSELINLIAPRIYFAYANTSMEHHQIDESEVNLVSYVLTMVNIEKNRNNQRDVLVISKLPNNFKTEFEVGGDLYAELSSFGFAQIIVDDKLVYYDHDNADLPTLKIADLFPLQPASFKYLLANSEPLVMVTGNTSLLEAISLGKIPFYQCLAWDKKFFQALIQINNNLGPANSVLADFFNLYSGLRTTSGLQQLAMLFSFNSIVTYMTTSAPQRIAQQFATFYCEHLVELKCSIQILHNHLALNYDLSTQLLQILDMHLAEDQSGVIEFYTTIYSQHLTELQNISRNYSAHSAYIARFNTRGFIAEEALNHIYHKTEPELQDMAKTMGQNYSVVMCDELSAILQVLLAPIINSRPTLVRL